MNTYERLVLKEAAQKFGYTLSKNSKDWFLIENATGKFRRYWNLKDVREALKELNEKNV